MKQEVAKNKSRKFHNIFSIKAGIFYFIFVNRWNIKPLSTLTPNAPADFSCAFFLQNINSIKALKNFNFVHFKNKQSNDPEDSVTWERVWWSYPTFEDLISPEDDLRLSTGPSGFLLLDSFSVILLFPVPKTKNLEVVPEAWGRVGERPVTRTKIHLVRRSHLQDVRGGSKVMTLSPAVWSRWHAQERGTWGFEGVCVSWSNHKHPRSFISKWDEFRQITDMRRFVFTLCSEFRLLVVWVVSQNSFTHPHKAARAKSLVIYDYFSCRSLTRQKVHSLFKLA